MGVFSENSEMSSAIPPARLFKAFVIDGDNLIVKILPQHIKGVEILEGDGGPGSIKKVTFREGYKGIGNYVKRKVEYIDEDNLRFCFSIIEGDGLVDNVEKISYDTKMLPSPDGGSILKTKRTLYTIGDTELTEEITKAGKEKGMGMFKAVETYLLENPDAYN